MQVSAAIKYIPNSGAGNFWTIADKDLSYTSTSMNAGGIGAIINQPLNNGFLGDESYSVKYARCVEEFGAEACKPSYTTLETAVKLGSPGNGFSTVNAISSINVALLNERPVSAVDYVQDKVYALTHFNVINAQVADDSITSREAYYSPGGTGFTLLKPIQNFWSWAVRVVYGFLLIIIVIIAFAIMFRQKLSGNVEVTVQNAIPAIAMAMILVPLSYAISGLFIDFITVGTNAVHAFLIGTPGAPGYSVYQGSSDPTNLSNPLDPANPYVDRGYYPDDVRVDWLRARDKINVATAFGDIAQDVGQVSGLNGNVIFLAVGSIVNALTGKGSSADPADFTWVGDIVQFFISIVTLWIGVQVFVHLFKKYITIILYPIMSPFIFATVAIPGNGTKSIMQYAKVMMAAALAFIVTYAMFILSIVFTSKEFLADVPTFASGSFNPPLLGLKSIGIGSNELTQLLLTLIGLGIYFSIPSTLKSIDTALGANNPLPKFITTPIDSFKESQKVMFKTAPALAARGATIAGTGLKNTVYAPSRANTVVRDALDRARGINPETNYNSYRNKTRRGLASKLDDYKADLEDAKRETNPALRAVKMASAQAKIASVGLAGDRKGTGVGLQGEMASSAPKFIIENTEVIIPRTEIPSLISASGIYTYTKGTGDITGGPGPHARIAVATGVFKAKVEGTGVQIKTPITLDFAKTKPTRDPNIDVFDDSKIIIDGIKKGLSVSGSTEFRVFDTDLEYKTPTTGSGYSPLSPATVEITINTAALQDIPKTDNTFDIPYIVYSTDVVDLFGRELNPSTNAPISAAAKLRSGYDVRTKKVSVRINNDDGLTTRAFRVNLKIG